MSTTIHTPQMKTVGFLGGAGLVAFVIMVCLIPVAADAADLATNAVLAGQPYDQELTHQLGKPLCVMHDSQAGTASYYFQSGSGASLKVVVNETRWAVDFSKVIAVKVTTSVLLPNGCAGLTHASLPTNAFQLASGRGHVQLGDSLDQVMQLFGNPEPTSKHEGLVRLEYSWDRDLYRVDNWTLSFREGHLVEWTIRTLPVFFEVGS
jgi:hypothetical protein